MCDSTTKKSAPGVNPILAIGLAILIAVIMSTACMLAYWHSDARRTVELIQNPVTSDSSVGDASALDTTSPVTTSDLDAVKEAISKDVIGLNPNYDFGANQLTDAALGL